MKTLKKLSISVLTACLLTSHIGAIGIVTKGTNNRDLIFIDGDGNYRTDATSTISIYQTNYNPAEVYSTDGVVFTLYCDANATPYSAQPYMSNCLSAQAVFLTWATSHFAEYTVAEVYNSMGAVFPDNTWQNIGTLLPISTDSFGGSYYW